MLYSKKPNGRPAIAGWRKLCRTRVGVWVWMMILILIVSLSLSCRPSTSLPQPPLVVTVPSDRKVTQPDPNHITISLADYVRLTDLDAAVQRGDYVKRKD